MILIKILLFQLINAMERVGGKNNLIGFSCGNQFVMTPMIAFKVQLTETFHFFVIVLKFSISQL